jgi:uncharacterized protein
MSASVPAGELVAIISDTHLPRGRRRLPEPCVELLRGAALIVHAGDVSTAAELQALRALGPQVLAVAGNVDEPALQAALPREARLRVGASEVAVVHDGGPARGRLARLRARFPECAAVVFGHSHVPMHERERGFQIFNPGSPTDRRRTPTHTMGIASGGAQDGIEFELIDLGP